MRAVGPFESRIGGREQSHCSPSPIAKHEGLAPSTGPFTMNISHMGCDRELSSRCGKSPSGHCPTQRNNQLEKRRRPDSSHSRFYCRTLINRMTAPGPEGEHDPGSEERRYSGLFSSDTKISLPNCSLETQTPAAASG